MATKKAFAKALKEVRQAQGITQEDFFDTSSRTYVSSLERGLKSPTLDKIHMLSQTLKVHPVTLILITYAYLEGKKVDDLLDDISKETATFRKIRN